MDVALYKINNIIIIIYYYYLLVWSTVHFIQGNGLEDWPWRSLDRACTLNKMNTEHVNKVRVIETNNAVKLDHQNKKLNEVHIIKTENKKNSM